MIEKWINPRVFPLLVVNFIGALGYSVILPFLIFLVQDFGGNAIMYALIGSLYPAFQMFGAPLLGAWSDKVGRKRVLLISQTGTFLSWAVFLLAFFLPLKSLFSFSSEQFGLLVFSLPLLILMLARAVDGLTGGNISVANAYLADITEPEERKANYGKLAAAMNLGFIIGPTLAGLLAALPNGKMLTVMAAMGISFIGIFIIQFFLPDIMPCGDDIEDNREDLKKSLNFEIKDCISVPDQDSASIWTIKNFKFYLLLYFLVFLTFNLFYATFPVHASDNLKWNSTALGLFFTLLSAAMIVTQTFVLPKLSKSIKDAPLFIGGSFILLFSFALIAVPSSNLIYLSAILYGLGNGLMWPSFLSMLSQLGDKSQQGKIQGMAGSAGSLASIIGLIAGGFIFSLISYQIFILSAIGIGIIGLLGFRLRD